MTTYTTSPKPVTFIGITAVLNLISMGNDEPALKQYAFTCSKETAQAIKIEAVKRGFPFEMTTHGINVYQ